MVDIFITKIVINVDKRVVYIAVSLAAGKSDVSVVVIGMAKIGVCYQNVPIITGIAAVIGDDVVQLGVDTSIVVGENNEVVKPTPNITGKGLIDIEGVNGCLKIVSIVIIERNIKVVFTEIFVVVFVAEIVDLS